MKTIKFLLIAVLFTVAYSASAQWTTSSTNTTTTNFVGIDYLTNPAPSQPLIKFAVANESYLGGRINCAGNMKAFTSTGKWTLGWGALLGSNMEFYSATHASTPGVLSFSFGGGSGLGSVQFRQSNGAGAYINCLYIGSTGNVGIGTITPTSKLAVNGSLACTDISANGKITTKEVEVTLSAFPDYVFDAEYQLSPLSEVEKFIKENKHLKGIPTAKEVVNNGLSLGDMNVKLMEKVEELTLYVIELQKQVDALKNK
jgi:hypothetical protein